MRLALASFVSSLLLAAGAAAQGQYTTTLPWANGDTVVVSVSTNALGVATTKTVSTLGGNAAVTTGTTTNTKTTKTTAGAPTTTAQRVVGQDTTAAPMRTTTYWYDPGDGVWVEATWTASVTDNPTVATANVPAGTVQDYNNYQTSVNSVVYASATAANALVSSGAGPRNDVWGGAGLGAVVVGAVGGIAGVVLL
ncbi:hypothetical protein EHS25_008108 [Saitozyma podzolica]|uniref:Uncharacterized protein n=1 Tax=Saitozyma podzolica TaxID=1890683 RepID=A0A427YNL1_9TREE|nr:hypothetical protein EHS25_008108 [Saitozyma podzolica]